MYKILIVDDEDIIRKSIVKIINWEKLGFDKVFDAENGLEALEILKTESIDLVLADIKMPIMDGLELARIIKNDFVKVSVVIISGHDEFQMAQEAIQHGVMDYILKPLGDESLSIKILEIKEKLDKKKTELQYINKIKDQLHQNLPLLREQHLNTLVCTPGDKIVSDARLEFLKIHLSEGPFCVCVIEPYFDISENEDSEIYLFAMKNIVHESVGDNHPLFSDSFRRIIVVFSYKFLSAEMESRILIYDILNAVSKSFEVFLSKSATFAVGSTVENANNLYTSYAEALKALDCKYTLGKGKIYDIYDLDYHDHGFVNPINGIEKVMIHIKSCQTNLLGKDFNEISSELITKMASASNGKIIFIQIITELLKIVAENLADNKEIWSEGLDIYSKIDHIQTVEEMADTVMNFARFVSEKIQETTSISSRSAVLKAMEYIRTHFTDETLSLESTASVVSVSPGYLSTLFKRESNVNFSDYLTRIRMEKAMELLRTTDLKTYEVAHASGFTNPHYFSISFKKHTGKTPSKFKQSDGGSDD